jgi:putative two-component system response regulator
MGYILIVDDDTAVRTSVCRLLRAGRYRTRPVADGAEALSAMRAARPALVLLDVSMPGMTGLEALRVAGADPSLAGVPIVMLTANEDRGTRGEAERLGARGFRIKGLDWPESLWRVVAKFVDPPGSAARSA